MDHPHALANLDAAPPQRLQRQGAKARRESAQQPSARRQADPPAAAGLALQPPEVRGGFHPRRTAAGNDQVDRPPLHPLDNSPAGSKQVVHRQNAQHPLRVAADPLQQNPPADAKGDGVVGDRLATGKQEAAKLRIDPLNPRLEKTAVAVDDGTQVDAGIALIVDAAEKTGGHAGIEVTVRGVDQGDAKIGLGLFAQFFEGGEMGVAASHQDEMPGSHVGTSWAGSS